jgi:ketosteroid isomerase-like protein
LSNSSSSDISNTSILVKSDELEVQVDHDQLLTSALALSQSSINLGATMPSLWSKKMTAEKTASIAKEFFDAIEAGRVDEVFEMFSADAKIWHNPDEVIVPREVTAKTLKAMHKFLINISYQDRQVNSWPTGFVERHCLTGVRKADGVKVRMPVCIVCEINGEGKITRLDEYFDSAVQNIFVAPPKAKI